MILDKIISGILYILYRIVSFIPDIDPFFDVDFNSINSATEYFGYLDSFVSLSVLTSCIAIVFVVYNFNFFVRAFKTIWNLFPFT